MPPNRRTKFGKILLNEREKRKMTQDEFAKFLGMSKQAISYYERGERTPKYITALSISKKLGIPIEEFEQDIEMENVKVIIQRELTEDESRSIDRLLNIQKNAEAIDILLSLPDELRKQAVDYLRFLAGQADKK